MFPKEEFSRVNCSLILGHYDMSRKSNEFVCLHLGRLDDKSLSQQALMEMFVAGIENMEDIWTVIKNSIGLAIDTLENHARYRICSP